MHYATKSMLLDAVLNLPRTIYNLAMTAKTSPCESNAALLRNLVLSMPLSDQEPYAAECRFLRSLPVADLCSIMFPYTVKSSMDKESRDAEFECGCDRGLPYVVHPSGRRVYYPRSTDTESVLGSFKGLLHVEGITGVGLLEKSPHCYQDSEFFLSDGDCLLDIGCAEALFAVDNLDNVSKAILFECERAWAKPLTATFQPYRDKVFIVDKMVSNHTSRKTTRIIDAIAGKVGEKERYFVKMDIEGGERAVIAGNEDFFRENRVKLSCCVYHRQDDASVIRDMLERFGYKTRFSDGYMLVDMNGIHFPYFRHGVIYAWNH